MRTGPAAYHRTPAPPPPSELGVDDPGSYPLDVDRLGRPLSLAPPDHPAILPPPDLGHVKSPTDDQLASITVDVLRDDYATKKAQATEIEEMLMDARSDRERARLRRSLSAKKEASRAVWSLAERLRGLDEDPVLADYAALVAAVRKLEADAASAPSVPLRARLIEAAEYLKLGKVDMREPDFAEPFAECCPPLAVSALYSSGLDPDRLPYLAPLCYVEDKFMENRAQRAQVAREAFGLMERGDETEDA